MVFTLTAQAISTVAEAAATHQPFTIAAAFYESASRETDPDARTSWTLLATAFTGRFETTNHRDPYSEPASSAITAENASEVLPVVAGISVASVRARLADLIWLRARPGVIRNMAMDSYCEAAQHAEDPKDWLFCARYAERCARLARTFKALDHPVFTYLQTIAEKYQDGSSLFLTIEAARILGELHPTKIDDLLPLLRRQADAMMTAGNFYVARQAYDLIVTFGRRMQNHVMERGALIDVARSYEREAEWKAQANANGLAAGFYKFAIEAYQQAGNARDEIDRIRPFLAEAEEKSLAELKRVERTFDATETVARAIKHVAGRPFPEALLAFVSIHPITDYDRLRQTVLDIAQQAPLTSMAARTILGVRGRTVGRRPGLTLNEADENESAVVGQMSNYLLQSHRGIVIQCLILPALNQLNEEHDITANTLRDLVAYAPIVPPDRRLLFLRGLAAGFDYDFMTAVHFLVPQLENVLRLLLQSRGVPTTIFDDGAEIERDLGKLLYEKRLEEILPKGLIFELQCFLVDRSGGNFRNQMAHGLFPDDAFESTDALYIWWLMLYLTLRLRPLAPADQPTPNDRAPPSNG
jgi:tetratricopeptide (TPR) repeat protein